MQLLDTAAQALRDIDPSTLGTDQRIAYAAAAAAIAHAQVLTDIGTARHDTNRNRQEPTLPIIPLRGRDPGDGWHEGAQRGVPLGAP